MSEYEMLGEILEENLEAWAMEIADEKELNFLIRESKGLVVRVGVGM